jgi:3',5'-cyclic AMP phosphodiesterase CpdA
MRKKVCIILFLLFSTYVFSDDFIKFPYVQNITDSSVTIMWENKEEKSGILTIGERVLPYPKAKLHEIMMPGLKPDTEYSYSIDSKAGGTFKTFPKDKDAPVHFLIYGDSRTNPEGHKKIGQTMKKVKPLFILHSGDYVTKGEEEEQWREQYFTPIADLIKNIPVFTAVGNHERESDWYHIFFSQPGNERYYSFDAGCVHVVVLDSMIRSLEGIKKQAKWLEKDLKGSKAAWTFAVFHHPPFSLRAAGQSMIVINHYIPLFYKYGVDFVFTGHDHYYKRKRPFKSGKNVISFIVSAGGGAHLRKVKPEEWDVIGKSVFHFTRIKASPSRITIEAVDANGVRFDKLVVDKNNLAQYTQNALDFKSAVSKMRKILPEEFFKDPDEINETLDIVFEQDPVFGKKVKVSVVVLSNPFDKTMHYNVAWDTSNTSWKISPAYAVLKAGPGESATAEVTAVPGHPMEPFPVLKHEFSFGKETIKGTRKIGPR